MIVSDDTASKLLIAFISFLLGAVLSRISMTKKESFDSKVKKQELSISLETQLTKSYQNYIDALAKFSSSSQINLDLFLEIEKSGAIYFNDINNLACIVLSETAEKNSIENSHIDKIRDAFERIIPKHYEALQFIAQKSGFTYNGKFLETNYKSLLAVVDKYA